MIQIKDLHKSYHMGSNSLHVLKGINFKAEEGEMILGMLDEADKGSYDLDGVPIRDLNEKVAAKYRNEFLGFIFQSFNLITYKSALDNVAMPLYYQGVKRSVRMEKALQYLDKVGLKDWAEHLPSELSGGQKQRVAIEPTGALDTTTSYEVMELIQAINDEGKTILVVTHEDDIAHMCKRIVHLKDGVIVSDEKVEQVRAKEAANV